MSCFVAPIHRFTAIIGEIDEELDSQIEQMKTISAGFPKNFYFTQNYRSMKAYE